MLSFNEKKQQCFNYKPLPFSLVSDKFVGVNVYKKKIHKDKMIVLPTIWVLS